MSIDLSLLVSLIPGGSTIEELAKTIREYQKEDSKKLLELEKKLIKSTNKDFLTDKQSIDKLTESFKHGRLTLVLGAGVSMDCGLPSWTNLLQKLIIKTIDNGNNDEKSRNRIASQLFNSVFGPNPLIAARYLNNHFSKLETETGETSLFEMAIRESLYEDFDNKQESKLIQEIVKLCVKRNTLKRISSVITYNYDDLLEKSIDNLKMDFEYKSIFTTGENPSIDELPIYHVHGFLPRKGKLSQHNRVTLSDSKYHSQYSDTYGWSNLVQINNFKEKNCLFIGVSFTDPNQRRLLDIAKEQRGSNGVQHFLLKRRYSPKEIENAITKVLKVNESILDDKNNSNLGLTELSKFLVEMVHNFETNDAHSFGIEIIWVNEYDDYSKILEDIRNKSKG